MNWPLLGTRWLVSNRSEQYFAKVVGYSRDRILIVNADLPSNIRQTPTHAEWAKFDMGDGYGEYLFMEPA
jgi:hypothetical protein